MAPVFETPAPDARLATQALHGEILDIFAQDGAFGLARCRRDHYVGWVPMASLSQPVHAPTHKVRTLRTHAYSAPDLKSPPQTVLSLGAHVTASGTQGDYVQCEHAGWVHTRHLAPLGTMEPDPVTTAERYLHTPYLWGGRDSLGLDCTGLTQQAFEAAGVLLPRDSDMQLAWAGDEIVDWKVSGALKRGDILFWKGHAGIMTDTHHLLHANAWHMAVAREPLEDAITRIKTYYAEPVGARRIDIGKLAGRVPDWMAEPVA
ncbi:NlpC/P60 family protein [Hyphomonas johnsonii MHS-2]|uniref:NlpC/P60 family protein n=2 Tax=Hyphomonas johnsonii TaxID=81031 RepID=A0A059FQH5_9PROT|nr:NlpC/P60 family protein [Hyphomonas johnsonii MHS-2]